MWENGGVRLEKPHGTDAGNNFSVRRLAHESSLLNEMNLDSL